MFSIFLYTCYEVHISLTNNLKLVSWHQFDLFSINTFIHQKQSNNSLLYNDNCELHPRSECYLLNSLILNPCKDIWLTQWTNGEGNKTCLKWKLIWSVDFKLWFIYFYSVHNKSTRTPQKYVSMFYTFALQIF